VKQLILNAVLSLVTGFCFVGGALLAVSLLEERDREDRTFVDNPQGFVFTEDNRTDEKANFTVEGKVENTTNIEWDNVQLFLEIYAGKAYMTSCQNGFDYFAPNSKKSFSIVCNDVPGYNIPDNVTYRLSVVRGAMKN
jgi:hypothetical protein